MLSSTNTYKGGVMRYLVVLLMLFGCASPPNMDDVEAAGIAEAKAYSAMLSAKMDRGELSEEEARYLYTQKVNELTQRFEATQRARQQRIPRQEVTTCKPDGYGGMRCTTR